MHKKFLLVLLIISSLFVFYACNNTNNGNDDVSDDTFKRKTMEPDEFDKSSIAEIGDDYILTWTDEFNNDGAPDDKRWNYEVGTGNGGWGNNESQYYTSRLDNAYCSDGTLKIVAKKEAYGGCNYTSARITTKAKGDFKYGYFEMRAKLPSGGGTWPAFWMMPTSSVYGYWPNSGELDIMEYVGNRPNVVLGTTHTKVSQGGGIGGSTRCMSAESDFNIYAMEWNETQIKFILNGNTYFTFNRLSTWTNEQWPFDQEFFIILNVAMGGNLGGTIASNFVESQMEVDYVRVYQKVDKSDTLAPAKPNITDSYSSTASITVSYDKPYDNQGIHHYEIVVNNKQVGATLFNTYTVSNLESDTSYKVRVIAVDYANNYTISDTVIITTKGSLKIPSKIFAERYTGASSDISIATSDDSGNTRMVALKNNTFVSFDVNSTAGTYSMTLRVAATVKSTLKIEVYKASEVLFTESISVTNSYGKYKDIVLANQLNLPGGNLTIKISCETTASANAMLLNYFVIE